MADSLKLDALVSNLGNYCRENNEELFSDALLDLDSSLANAGITVLDGIKDEYPLPNLEVSDIIKPSDNRNFSGKADAIVFDSRMLKVRDGSGDLQIWPKDFEKTWLSFNRAGRAKAKGTYKEWMDVPYHEFIVKKVMEKVKEEVRKATWVGVYNAAGTGFADLCNGILKLVIDEIAAGNIVTETTGVVTENNAFIAVRDVVGGLGDAYADKPGKCIVSRQIFDWYVRTPESVAGRTIMLNQMSAAANAAGQGKIFVPGTNVELIKEPSLGSSQRIIAYTDGVVYAGTDTQAEINEIEFQKFERSIKMLLDFKWGVNFSLCNATHKPIVANEQV